MKNKVTLPLIISIIIAFIPFIIYIILYSRFPETIAIHYNNSGAADRFVGKTNWEIFLLCSLGFISIVPMKILSSHTIKLSEKEDNLKVAKLLMNSTLILITLLFSGMSIYFLLLMTGELFFTKLVIFKICIGFIAIVLIILGYCMSKLKRNSTLGFRNNYTLKDDMIWDKTQKLAGRAWEIGGIIIFITNIISMLVREISLITLICIHLFVIILILFIPYYYSYRLWKK